MFKLDIRKVRSLMYVRRLNFERCNRYENVAEHSFYVGVMAYRIAIDQELGEEEARYCLKMGLMHDMPEAVTGDIPFLVRRAMGKMAVVGLDEMGAKELNISLGTDSRTLEIVKLADILEFALYLKEETVSGNRHLQPIYCETLGRLLEYLEMYGDSIENILGVPRSTILEVAKALPKEIKH